MVIALHRLISHCLVSGPKTVQQLYKMMPQEKRKSVRAVCTLHPDKFLRIRKGFVGLRGRDEYLAAYQQLFEELGSRRPEIDFVVKCFLATGEKTLGEVKKEFPMIKEDWFEKFLSQHSSE